VLEVVFTSFIFVVYDCTKVQKVVDLHACGARSYYFFISGMALLYTAARGIFFRIIIYKYLKCRKKCG
jgi:hypothetical protein